MFMYQELRVLIPSNKVVHQSGILPAKSLLLGARVPCKFKQRERAEHCGHAQDLPLRVEEATFDLRPERWAGVGEGRKGEECPRPS